MQLWAVVLLPSNRYEEMTDRNDKSNLSFPDNALSEINRRYSLSFLRYFLFLLTVLKMITIHYKESQIASE